MTNEINNILQETNNLETRNNMSREYLRPFLSLCMKYLNNLGNIDITVNKVTVTSKEGNNIKIKFGWKVLGEIEIWYHDEKYLWMTPTYGGDFEVKNSTLFNHLPEIIEIARIMKDRLLQKSQELSAKKEALDIYVKELANL